MLLLITRLFVVSVAKVYARMGKSSEARRMFEGLKKEASRSDLEPDYAALGDKDEAFRLLFNMVEKREGSNVFIGNRSAVRQPTFRSALEGTASPDEPAGEVDRRTHI